MFFEKLSTSQCPVSNIYSAKVVVGPTNILQAHQLDNVLCSFITLPRV